jgi:arsenical pump membrane protein
VLVAALEQAGLVGELIGMLRLAEGVAGRPTALAAGVLVALLCNLTNNLPAGLIAGTAVQGAGAPTLLSGRC